MDHSSAVSTVGWIRKPPLAVKRSINFVSPVISSMLAASHLSGDDVLDHVEFGQDASFYASCNGLLDTLQGKIIACSRSGRQGSTYSQLTRLAAPTDVDFCNSVINDVIFTQLAGYNQHVVQQLTKVVGELHDNIPSHAWGAGFSAVQVYERKNEKAIEFAIADAGRGMLRNILRSNAAPAVDTHGEAIKWCLTRGNTTAKYSDDGWEQWLPDDFSGPSPFPDAVGVTSTEDHHMGEGLWILKELIRTANGELWILTGDAEYSFNGSQERITPSRIDWSGVAIEFEIPIPRSEQKRAAQQDEFDKLAEELGL